jgi:hypothetical protein
MDLGNTLGENSLNTHMGSHGVLGCWLRNHYDVQLGKEPPVVPTCSSILQNLGSICPTNWW